MSVEHEVPPVQAVDQIIWLQKHHPSLVAAMRSCSHHFSHQHLNPWHLEGDVWTHSLMVLDACRHLPQVDAVQQWVALLHDVGKPGARRELPDKHRVLFQGHESLSAFISWDLLADPALGLSLAQRLLVFQLVALHGALYSGWFGAAEALDTAALQRAFSGMGQAFWQRLLRQVACDMQGQWTKRDNNKQGLLALLDLPMSPVRLTADERVPAVLLVGPPGSGKSRLRQRYAGFVVVSRDDALHQVTGESSYRRAWERHDREGLASAVDACLEQMFHAAVQGGKPVLVDMTNLTRKQRARWLSRLPDDVYLREAVVVVCGQQTLVQRNAQRGDKAVPDGVLAQMLLRLELPLFDEFDQIAYVVEGQQVIIQGHENRYPTA